MREIELQSHILWLQDVFLHCACSYDSVNCKKALQTERRKRLSQGPGSSGLASQKKCVSLVWFGDILCNISREEKFHSHCTVAIYERPIN